MALQQPHKHRQIAAKTAKFYSKREFLLKLTSYCYETSYATSQDIHWPLSKISWSCSNFMALQQLVENSLICSILPKFIFFCFLQHPMIVLWVSDVTPNSWSWKNYTRWIIMVCCFLLWVMLILEYIWLKYDISMIMTVYCTMGSCAEYIRYEKWQMGFVQIFINGNKLYFIWICFLVQNTFKWYSVDENTMKKHGKLSEWKHVR